MKLALFAGPIFYAQHISYFISAKSVKLIKSLLAADFVSFVKTSKSNVLHLNDKFKYDIFKALYNYAFGSSGLIHKLLNI